MARKKQQSKRAQAPRPRRTPMGELLQEVRRHWSARVELERKMRRDVVAAREAGASWSQIGAALGVSKQAAQQRYGQPAAAGG